MRERLNELLNAKPFARFAVIMSYGSRHDVRHPEHVLLAKHWLILVDADDDEKIHDLYLLHVAHIERTTQSEASGTR